MEIPIRPKLYSFHEAFNALGRELFPNWTGEEVNAQECHFPEDVESVADLPERLLEFTVDMAKAPDVDPADLQKHIDGWEHARLSRQSAPWAQEIKDLDEDPEAYEKRYALWFYYDTTYQHLIEIMHDGRAAGWIETPEGDTYEIQRTHWGGASGPFTPNLPGNCGEYRGAWGEAWGNVWIDKKGLDRSLKFPHPTPITKLSRRAEMKRATRQKREKWERAIVACEQEHPDWKKSQILDEVAEDLNIEEESEKGSLKRRMYDPGGPWAK